MAFLGAVSIAFPAMKAVAKRPLQERNDVFYQYGRQAFELQSKEYVVANLQNLEHKEILEALLFSLQLIKSEKGLEGTQWTKPTCDFIKKEFEKMIVNEEY